MRFILEFDGVITDVMPAFYAAHRVAAEAVGWSRLDEATFRRLIRTKGREADVLPGAKQVKLDAYEAKFLEIIEEDAGIAELTAQDGLFERFRQFLRFGAVVLVATGRNIDARRQWIARQPWAEHVERFERLDEDARRRPVELGVLSEGDDRTVAVASSDVLVRSADAAGLFVVGVSTGTCSVKRLQQAGARVVYKALDELTTSLRNGAADLIRAGMLPLADA